MEETRVSGYFDGKTIRIDSIPSQAQPGRVEVVFHLQPGDQPVKPAGPNPFATVIGCLARAGQAPLSSEQMDEAVAEQFRRE